MNDKHITNGSGEHHGGHRQETTEAAAGVLASSSLVAGVAGFLVLAIAGLTSKDALFVRAAYLSMSLTAWFVIVPLMLAALLIGTVQSLGTRWGLLQVYWIVAKFVLTILAAVVLLLQLRLRRTVSLLISIGFA